MENYEEPFGWWGGGQGPAQQPRSVVQLLSDGVIDSQVAGLLWMALARRASVLVASRPHLSGKTTLLTALLDFLPPGITRIFLRGWYETFDFARRFRPERSYLLANEISPHLATYLWGPKVAALFELLDEGWRLGSTIHAESVEEIASQLAGRDVGVAPAEVAAVDLVIVLRIGILGGKVWRRATSLLVPLAATAGALPTGLPVAAFSPAEPAATLDPAGLAALARRLGIARSDLEAELRGRAAYLDDLARRQIVTVPAVREAIRRYAP